MEGWGGPGYAEPGMEPSLPRKPLSAAALGTLYGVAAALCWAAGFVAAKHAIGIGLAPVDLAFHRFVWPGILLVPVMAQAGFRDLGGVGWGRGLILLCLAGPLQAMSSYSGLLLAPLGHGAVIQPASAALGGTLLAFFLLHEPLTRSRVVGIIGIVIGLVIFAGEAITHLGGKAPLGDALFVASGATWAVFTICLRSWGVSGTVATRVICVLSLLIYAPLFAMFFGFERMQAAGIAENLLQVATQGILAGPLAIYLFARSVTALGAGRASTFPALVPAFTIVIGFLVLHDVPSVAQLIGLAVGGVGFRFALKP
jgi:drug/metabolite transporter (DMT)-like permease